MPDTPNPPSEDDEVDLFMELFRKYRNHGCLPEPERQRFRELATKLKEKGYIP